MHRNASEPAHWFSGDVITNSAVHEIDLARWLLNDEIVAASVYTPGAGRDHDAQVLILESAGGVLVDIEVFVNARYGYDVRCELVGEEGSVSRSMRHPRPNCDGPGQPAAACSPTGGPALLRRTAASFQDWVEGIRNNVTPGGADG